MEQVAHVGHMGQKKTHSRLDAALTLSGLVATSWSWSPASEPGWGSSWDRSLPDMSELMVFE